MACTKSHSLSQHLHLELRSSACQPMAPSLELPRLHDQIPVQVLGRHLQPALGPHLWKGWRLCSPEAGGCPGMQAHSPQKFAALRLWGVSDQGSSRISCPQPVTRDGPSLSTAGFSSTAHFFLTCQPWGHVTFSRASTGCPSCG